MLFMNLLSDETHKALFVTSLDQVWFHVFLIETRVVSWCETSYLPLA